MRTCIFLVTLAAFAACHSPRRDQLADGIERWGSLREVLREHKTERRVEFARVLEPHSVGIGLADGLAAEIVVLDGEVWFGRARGESEWIVERGATEGSGATFLVLAQVDVWREIPIERDVTAEEFEVWLGERATEFELGPTWPFVIEGRFEALEAHVLRGACPLAEPNAPEPVRPNFEGGTGRLVGMFARTAAGMITHHDELAHTHVVLETPTAFVGHVDSVALTAGSILRIPRRNP